MGACFSKIFNGCPLHINCSASWIQPETRDQIIFIGADEGIYALNLNEMHDGILEQVHASRCAWLHVVKNIMMSVSGKNNHLFRHDLMMIYSKKMHRLSAPVTKLHEKLVPRKFNPSAKVPETKGIRVCSVVRNPYNGYKYLAAALNGSLLLMQWYEPLNKFMQLRVFELALPEALKCFELIVTPESEYPLICVGVTKSQDSASLKFDLINLNSSTTWFSMDDYKDRRYLDVANVSQLEKDTVLVAYEKTVKIVGLNGRLKPSSKLASQLNFDFPIQALVRLRDSVLAFHEHGMQGKSFKTNAVTQEIIDGERMYRMIGSDRYTSVPIVLIESRPSDQPEASSNLYVLAGHETSY